MVAGVHEPCRYFIALSLACPTTAMESRLAFLALGIEDGSSPVDAVPVTPELGLYAGESENRQTL